MYQEKTNSHSHAHDHARTPAPAGSIHGHVILQWLADTSLSSGALATRVANAFGSTPQFHTCDQTGLSLDSLLALLAERGKIRQSGEGWRSDMSKVCADV